MGRFYGNLTPSWIESQAEVFCKIAQPVPKNAEVEVTETAHAETKDLRDPKEQARAHKREKRTQQQAKRRRCEQQQPQVDMATFKVILQNSPQVHPQVPTVSSEGKAATLITQSPQAMVE